ncbi:hypothetical protein LX32DRAFT_156281 [Colletotrichum zoysiae]|uniref:Uncharacterized protein n=1 Tax=Colletotrichum zoysiae TaxID=1216348 RepID=A0AAD9HR85_9PEZI|nr:hypothetical protein LX32DRAFT_156281 [Colletotrichum zoysiae]
MLVPDIAHTSLHLLALTRSPPLAPCRRSDLALPESLGYYLYVLRILRSIGGKDQCKPARTLTTCMAVEGHGMAWHHRSSTGDAVSPCKCIFTLSALKDEMSGWGFEMAGKRANCQHCASLARICRAHYDAIPPTHEESTPRRRLAPMPRLSPRCRHPPPAHRYEF